MLLNLEASATPVSPKCQSSLPVPLHALGHAYLIITVPVGLDASVAASPSPSHPRP